MKIEADWIDADGPQAVMGLLTGPGHQAFFVGGCVRNALLGAPVSDVDIATDARPETVIELAQGAGLKTVPTGIEHGTVTVISGHDAFEVTTFRRDVDTDGRRAVVAFSDSVEEDARRRDFTMNALYADADGTVFDPLGTGLPDLQARRVRFIDDPLERIREDYLRILRFFRFHAWYGDPQGGIDPDGMAACGIALDGLDRLASERNWQEMKKLLSAPDPAPALAAMSACGALPRLMPGAFAAPIPVMIHIEREAGLAPDPIRRLALLGGSIDRLRLSKAEAAQREVLLSDMSPAEMAWRHGPEVATDKLAMLAAQMGQRIDPEQRVFVRFAAQQSFPLRAADLMPHLEGPALGEALREAEARWISSDFTLGKDDLLA